MNKAHQKPKRTTKRLAIICIILLIVFVACNAASIKAYFTDMESSTNTFSLGKTVVKVIEDTENQKISVYNDGTVDCYIRVFAEMERSDMTFSISPEQEWTKNGDYYYYQSYVEPGEPVAFLTGVNFASGDEIIVYAECIQAKETGTCWNAFEVPEPQDNETE